MTMVHDIVTSSEIVQWPRRSPFLAVGLKRAVKQGCTATKWSSNSPDEHGRLKRRTYRTAFYPYVMRLAELCKFYQITTSQIIGIFAFTYIWSYTLQFDRDSSSLFLQQRCEHFRARDKKQPTENSTCMRRARQAL